MDKSDPSKHGAIIYGSMDRQTLDAAYNNSAAVADSERYLADWLGRSKALRTRMPDHLDLVYGDAPRARLPFRAAKLIIAYRADELPELKRQSRSFAAAWGAQGLLCEPIELADCHHYAVLEQLAQPAGALARALAVSAGADPR